MKRAIYHIKQHPIIYSVLFIIALLAILFFSLSHVKTKEHYARAEHAISLDGIVTDCQYREVEHEEQFGDDWHTVTEHYYLVFVEYECGGKNYTWTYQSDDFVPQGQTQKLVVDINDPEYVFNDGNPGEALLAFGIICTAIFVLIVSIWTLGLKAIFCLFALGTVGFLIGTVSFALSKGPWLLFLFGFVGHSAVSYFLFRACISKGKAKKVRDDSLK